MSKSTVFEFCRRWRFAFFGTLTITFMVSTAAVTPARALFAETAAAGLLINHFGNVAKDLIDKGRNSGDFLLWRLGIHPRAHGKGIKAGFIADIVLHRHDDDLGEIDGRTPANGYD